MNDDNIYVLHPGGKRKAKEPGTHLALRRDLQSDAYTINMFALDTFTRQLMLLRPVPRPNLPLAENFESRLLKETDIIALIEHFEERGFKKLSTGLVRDVIMLEAETNAYSPVAAQLRSFVWDTVPRLDDFFLVYAGVEIEGDTDEERDRFRTYVQAVTRCFFISVIARVMRPGCKVDTMLVLEGQQGARKSSLLNVLALRDDWFSDSLPHDLASKDAREHLPGRLIIEMAEMSQLRRSEMETVKSFLTCRFDKYRPSYGRVNISWPRQNVFVGTTNTDDYLVDATGNRRFWPLKTTTIHVEDAAIVIEQVYAEARAAFDCGEDWWLDPKTEEIAKMVQETRLAPDAWHDRIAEIVADRPLDIGSERWIRISDVLETLGVPLVQRTRSHEMRIAATLTQLGGVRLQRRIGTRRQWAYRMRK